MRHIKEKATSERKRTNKQKAKLTQTTGRRSRGAGWGALRRGKGGPTRGDGRRRIGAVHTRWSTQTSRYEAAHRKRRVSNRCHPREVHSTGTTRHLASPVHAPRAGAHAPAGLGAGPGDTAPSLLLTLRPPSAACSGPGCRVRLCALPLGPSPRTGWESADQGLWLAELSRSRATQQVTNAASGLPALAIKVSECRPGPRVLLSAADPRPTALWAPGKGGWRTAPPGHLCPSLPTSRHQGTSSGSGRGCLLAQTTEGRAAAYSASFPSPPPTHAVVFGQPLPSLCPMCHLQEAGY